MNFLQKVKDSIYSPAFYSQAPLQTFGQALKYFSLLALLLIIVRTITIIPIFVTVQNQAPGWVQQVVGYYPQDLQINIKNGEVSTNQQEPYFIPLTKDPTASASGRITNLLVIDTKNDFSSTKFREYNAFAWLTKDTLFYQDTKNNQIKAYDLSKISSFTVNQGIIHQWSSYLDPYYKLIAPILAICVFLGLIFLYAAYLIRFLITGLIVWLIVKVLGKPYTYGQAYKITLYASTLGLILEVLLGLTMLGGLPFMFTILTAIVVVINYRVTTTPPTV